VFYSCCCDFGVLLPNAFVHYLIAISFAALATGCQIVLLPWLAVGELKLSAEQVGWVQSLSLLPGVVLLLVGGAFADRTQGQHRLPFFYMGLALCHGFMAYLLFRGELVLSWLLIYALMMGVSSAFIQPLRERLLPGLLQGENRLQHSVVVMSLCLYVAQAVGVAVAGQQGVLGVHWILLGQGACLLVAALMFAVWVKAPSVETASAPRTAQSVAGIKAGLALVWRHSILRNLVILVGLNGFIHIGVFVVALPLLARDAYQQGAVYFASLQLCFVVGNVVATLGLLKRGPTRYPGRAILFSLLYAGVLMLAIAAKPTLNGLFGLVFFWGVVAGVSASLGKSLLQQQAPEAYRGRIVSVYQLSLFGAAPLGALACGYAASYWGPWLLFSVAGVVSIAAFLVHFVDRSLWGVENLDAAAES